MNRGGKNGGPETTSSPSGWRGRHDPHWLEQKVRDTYRDVVDEPIPDELLHLVGRIPNKLDE
jgi:hypothetical protein